MGSVCIMRFYLDPPTRTWWGEPQGVPGPLCGPPVARGRAQCMNPSGVCSFAVGLKVTFAHPHNSGFLVLRLV